MELTETLDEFSLSKREAELHLALLRKMKFTAAEHSKITSITVIKIYGNLRNPVYKGKDNKFVESLMI